jgi:hypothetical protein
MSFKLVGEVVIDGRKGTTALKDLQREANKTSDTFRRAGGNTERLGKSLLSLGLNAGRAGTSLGALSRLGAGGLFGAAVLGSINKFGETVKQASTDYYQSQKALSDAFEMSFKSTSVEQAQAGLEKTEDTIESLRSKITQLGAFGGILKGIEKFTGINIGVGDTERALKQAQDQLLVQEEIVKLKQKEAEKIKNIEKQSRSAINISKQTQETLKFVNETEGGRQILVDLAKEELKQAVALRDENIKILDTLIESNREGNNKEQINARNIKSAELELQIYKLQNNVIRAQKAEKAVDSRRAQEAGEKAVDSRAVDSRAVDSRRAQEAGGGLLGASRAGQQALDVARKVRAREVSKEDFRTQDQVFTQDMRNRVAAQQAAGEMPLLSEKLGAMQGTTPASQIAAEQAKGGGGKDVQDQLLKAIEALTKKLPAAVATG